MPQRIEQVQMYCNRCQRATLHQGTRTETNHVLHLLLTFLLCTLWLPIWLLIVIVNSLEKPRFSCTQCGQPAGQLTPEQQAPMSRQTAAARQRVAAETARSRAESQERRAEFCAAAAARLSSAGSATISELKRLPGRTDRVLRVIAGDGNDILLWFLRVLTFLAVGLGVGGLAGVSLMFLSALLTAGDPAESATARPIALTEPVFIDAESATARSIALTEPVFINIEERILPGNRLIIRGTTNLPVGTHLMFGVSEVGNQGFVGQAKGMVGQNGRFESPAFGPSGGLDNGKYEVDVTMPIVQVQPEAVKQTLGGNGEHLQGPLVERNDLGVSVHATKDVIVGGPHALQQEAERQRNERDHYLALYKKAEELYQEVESFRRENASVAEWAAFLRSFDAKVSQFEEPLRDAGLLSAGAQLRGISLGYLALAANPHRATYSFKRYQSAVETYHEYMAEAKALLDVKNQPDTTPEPSHHRRTWTDATGKSFIEAEFGGDGGGSATSNSPSSQTRRAGSAPRWYEGGTLHKKSGLEWQTASSKDKLATCADFVTAMWQNGNLKSSVANRLSTVEDVRPYAQELVDFLDAAFKPDPDSEQNRKLFTNQRVASTAVIGMVMMGWTKRE